VEEQKEAFQARRGPWSQAPQCDELWDGDRRMFWEKELSADELKEVLRYRRLSRYANLVQGFNSALHMNLPVPKPPPVVDDLVRRSMDMSPVAVEYQERIKEMFGIASPPPRSPNSPDSPDVANKRPKVDVKIALEATTSSRDSPRASEQRKSAEPRPADPLAKLDSPSSRSLARQASKEDAVDSPSSSHAAKHMSLSQLATQNASKSARSAAAAAALAQAVEPSKRRESVNEQDMARRKRTSTLIRARRRRAPLLKPWFVLLYFFTPLFLLGLTHWLPWMTRVVVPAYWENRAVRTALDVPVFLERLLHLSDAPIMKSTVYFGIFAIEVTSIAYVFFVLLSNVMVILVLRPVIVSLSRPITSQRAYESAVAATETSRQ